ncbi:unnamed protein product [Phytophthora lilii]|uniref:Unnamed protein product n=1 Tax=Phytophthora lilii TaxID=2077276 RepID=A0A9W6TM85_9STRA|nr:unnamed protein product [Phytophthora lilii]
MRRVDVSYYPKSCILESCASSQPGTPDVCKVQALRCRAASDIDHEVEDQSQLVKLDAHSITSESSQIVEKDVAIPIRLQSKIARRQSTQVGVVYPDASEENHAEPATPVTKPLRRSVSTRMMLGMSAHFLAPRLSFASGFNPKAAVELLTTEGDAMIDHPPETPYEEMMVRFQIRQLQRTPSTLMNEERRGTEGSSRGLMVDIGGGGSDTARATARGSVTQVRVSRVKQPGPEIVATSGLTGTKQPVHAGKACDVREPFHTEYI